MTYQFNLREKKIVIMDGDKQLAEFICRQATGDEQALLTQIGIVETATNKAEWEKVGAGNLSQKDIRRQYFRARVYPKLAACTTTADNSPLPTADEAWSMPATEQNKWLEAVSFVNPSWFDEWRSVDPEQVKEVIASGKVDAETKKKSRKRH